MPYKILNISRKALTYGFFNAIYASFPFFLLPILTRYLSVEEYGIIALISIVILFLGPIFRLEIQGALKREYIENKEDFTDYVGTSLFIPVFIFSGSLIVFVAFYPFLSSVWGITPLWLLGILVITLGTALSAYLSALYQIMDKALYSGLWEVLSNAPVFLGAFVLIVFFGFDWQGRIWPALATSIFIQIPLTFYLIYQIIPYRLVFHLNKTKELLKFSMPLIPMTIVTYILQVADRIFITEIVGLEAAGLYAVSGQLAGVMVIAQNAFMPTWEVLVFQKLKENTQGGGRYILLLFTLFILAIVSLSLLVIFIFPYIMPYILGKSFMGSMDYLAWLVVGVSMRGVFYALLPFIYYIKKTTIVMYTNIFLVILYGVLNYILILTNGAIGAAQANLIVYITGFMIFLYVILKYIKIPTADK